MSTLAFDIEVYPNFFLALFKDVETGEIRRFQSSPKRSIENQLPALQRTLENNTLVGFNSNGYDLPLLQLALRQYSRADLYKASCKIIIGGMRPFEFREEYDLKRPDWDHIDLMEVCPLEGSLKIYAGRLHCKRMQDLPYDPNEDVTADQAAKLIEYCANDLDNTILIWQNLQEQMKLRVDMSHQYGVDLRSKSDAQIAEAVISAELSRKLGYIPERPKHVKRTVKYHVPENLTYTSGRLNVLLDEIRDADFKLKDNGSVILPDCLNTVIRIGSGAYRMGIGGLHSSEKSTYYCADSDTLLIDRDVASYYPSIILTQRLYPAHLGEAFLTVYGEIVSRRLAAKKAKQKVIAESLKIVINGSFGKFGSMWSRLYSPQLMIQVTISGQLYLLMLIEMIENAGIEVISGNTDGIVIRCPKARYDDLTGIIAAWENITGFATEETRYKALYSRDVNNYIALKEDGSSKGKGVYANHWTSDEPNIFKFHKNPTCTVCIEAVIARLADGTPLSDTIRACTDIRKFVAVRTVRGGANDRHGYLGKAVRFYYAVDETNSTLQYAKRKAKVSKSDGAKALMELPERLPGDINYGWYINEAEVMLGELGYLQRGLFAA